MLAIRLIERKRNGGRIEAGEWRALALAYAAGHVLPDYQMAALLMAAFIRGLDHAETVALTEAMLDSGDRLDTSGLKPTGRGQALRLGGRRQGIDCACAAHGECWTGCSG